MSFVVGARLGVAQDGARRDPPTLGIQRFRHRRDGGQGDGLLGGHEGLDGLSDVIERALSPWGVDLLLEPGGRVTVRARCGWGPHGLRPSDTHRSVHFLELGVAVADELLHAFGLGVEPLGGGQRHLRRRPLAVSFDLMTLGGIRDLPGAADAGELRGAEAVTDAVAPDHLGEGADLAAGRLVERLQFGRGAADGLADVDVGGDARQIASAASAIMVSVG